MVNEILLNPSDSELFDDIPESSPSPIIPHRQQARTRSTIHIVRHSQPPSTGGSSTIRPSHPPNAPGDDLVLGVRLTLLPPAAPGKASMTQPHLAVSPIVPQLQNSIPHRRTPQPLPGSQPRAHRSADDVITSGSTSLTSPPRGPDRTEPGACITRS